MITMHDDTGAALASRYARFAAVLLLVTVVAGVFGEMYVPSKIIVGSDAAATASHWRDSQLLFRLGFAAYLVEAICDIALMWLFFVLLRPVHRDLALLTVLFGLISTATFAGAQLIYFSPTLLLRDAAYLSSFTSDQRDTLTLLALKTSNLGAGVFMVFYGLATVLRGVLMVRSTYLPASLGVLLTLAGFGFTTRAFLVVLAPRMDSPLLLLPMLLAMVSMIVWFLARGIDVTKWDETQRASAQA